MLWWWLTQFKLVGKVTTGLSDFFTVPAKRIEGTTRADQQTYGEKGNEFIQAIAISLNTGCHLGIKVSNCHLGISKEKKKFLFLLKPVENHLDFYCCILLHCFAAGLWAGGSFGGSAAEAILSFLSFYLRAFRLPFYSAELLHVLYGKLNVRLNRSCVNHSIYKLIASD